MFTGASKPFSIVSSPAALRPCQSNPRSCQPYGQLRQRLQWPQPELVRRHAVPHALKPHSQIPDRSGAGSSSNPPQPTQQRTSTSSKGWPAQNQGCIATESREVCPFRRAVSRLGWRAVPGPRVHEIESSGWRPRARPGRPGRYSAAAAKPLVGGRWREGLAGICAPMLVRDAGEPDSLRRTARPPLYVPTYTRVLH